MNTIFTYNWEALQTYTKKDCKKILHVVNTIAFNKVLAQDDDIIRTIANIAKKDKTAYIVDIKGMLSFRTTVINKCAYLFIASKRNYFEAIMHGETRVPRYLVDIDEQKLRFNPLLKVDDKFITLLF